MFRGGCGCGEALTQVAISIAIAYKHVYTYLCIAEKYLRYLFYFRMCVL